MTESWMPLLRQAAAFARRALCTVPMRFAIVVGIVVATASSSHAATPFEEHGSGSAPDVRITRAPTARPLIMPDDPKGFGPTREALIG